MKGELYRITYNPTGQKYYGIIWKPGKTIQDRFNEHLSGEGGCFIKKLIDEGADPFDFKIESIQKGELELIKDLEVSCAEFTLWPKGLNGNTGDTNIVNSNIFSKEQIDNPNEEITRQIKEAMRIEDTTTLTRSQIKQRRNNDDDDKYT